MSFAMNNCLIFTFDIKALRKHKYHQESIRFLTFMKENYDGLQFTAIIVPTKTIVNSFVKMDLGYVSTLGLYDFFPITSAQDKILFRELVDEEIKKQMENKIIAAKNSDFYFFKIATCRFVNLIWVFRRNNLAKCQDYYANSASYLGSISRRKINIDSNSFVILDSNVNTRCTFKPCIHVEVLHERNYVTQQFINYFNSCVSCFSNYDEAALKRIFYQLRMFTNQFERILTTQIILNKLVEEEIGLQIPVTCKRVLNWELHLAE